MFPEIDVVFALLVHDPMTLPPSSTTHFKVEDVVPAPYVHRMPIPM